MAAVLYAVCIALPELATENLLRNRPPQIYDIS